MAEKAKFVKLKLKGGIEKVYIDVNEIASYYDRDNVYGGVRLKDGTVYETWENADMIRDAIRKCYI